MTNETIDAPDIDLGPARISRRKLIQRAGVVGAIAWTAPTVMSMNSPAFAASTPSCAVCTTGYQNAPRGCGGAGGCSDGSGGYCDTMVEGPCTCDVAPYIVGSNGCTSSAACASAYGPGIVCIHDDADGTTVCIAQCNAAAPAAKASKAFPKYKTINRRNG